MLRCTHPRSSRQVYLPSLEVNMYFAHLVKHGCWLLPSLDLMYLNIVQIRNPLVHQIQHRAGCKIFQQPESHAVHPFSPMKEITLSQAPSWLQSSYKHQLSSILGIGGNRLMVSFKWVYERAKAFVKEVTPRAPSNMVHALHAKLRWSSQPRSLSCLSTVDHQSTQMSLMSVL